ncbi:hypothetical protein F8388_022481 [Cannabis sativa]|uniref:Uncharacterized protein n=1 Tax=Cannabis sativa TaxID=3483 RepID=A0A7J6EWM6_CANSA|nr:hypothetical protein F8388_022481 [Cannabis sativa]
MSSVGTSKGILEIAKFGLYVSVPIVLMYAFANNSKNIKKFMGNCKLKLILNLDEDAGLRELIMFLYEVGICGTFFNFYNPSLFHTDDLFHLNCQCFFHDYDRAEEYDVNQFPISHSYVVYPPEAPRPHSPEEMREMARELARKKNVR